jgi:MFS family permease
MVKSGTGRFVDRRTFVRVVALWIIPIAFVFGAIVSEAWLHGSKPDYSAGTIVSFSLISSAIWVPVGLICTILFGGFIVDFFLRLLAHKKLFKRTLVVPAAEHLKKLSTEREQVELNPKTMLKIFALVFVMNFIYVLFLTGRGWVPTTARPQIIFTQVEGVSALLFIPLLTLVIPLSVGKIKVRQVDNRPVDSYWLWLILAIAGGAGVVLAYLQRGVLINLIPSAFLFAVCAWYAALGALLALPTADKVLAKRLLKMRGHEKVIFGKIWAGYSKEKAKEV